MTKEALIKWYDSGAENREEFIALVEQALAQPSDSEYARGFGDGQKEFAEIAGGAWQTAVIDQLVIHHIYTKEHDTDPRKAVHDLLCISNDIALDPRVSSDAQALIDRGRREAQQEQPAQEVYAWVPKTMILEDADLRFLHGLSQPDDNDGSFSPIALTVGDGHAGYGLYASLSEYPEEGADIICKFSAPTQPALSSADIAHIFQRIYPEKLPESDLRFLDFGRAIEAHCRGGADK